MKPLGKTKLKWSQNFAYTVGLIATDGCLSIDGRHITLVSKDKEQIENFIYCLGIKNKIGKTNSGSTKERKYFRVQFSDVLFYKLLIEIGITPQKTKTIGALAIPDEYFFDFLRGHYDGDGSFYAYWDPRWKSSYMFYLTFVSASISHVQWLYERIYYFIGIRGRITKAGNIYQLRYAKNNSLQIFKKMYYCKQLVCLSRKRKKIERLIKVEGFHL
jgi:hypothetical protein